MIRALRSGRVLLLTPLLVLALTSACTADDPPEPQSSAEPEAGSAKAKTTLREVSGRLSSKRRPPLKRKVSEAVDAWVESAYLGNYPRTDFDGAFDGFTPRARRKAEAAASLMSNAELGDRLESVTATKRRYRVDALAVRNQPAGVTVHIDIALVLAGELERTDRVRGRLHLAKDDKQWRIFGFDLERRQR